MTADGDGFSSRGASFATAEMCRESNKNNNLVQTYRQNREEGDEEGEDCL